MCLNGGQFKRPATDTPMPPYTVTHVRWPEHSTELLAIRRTVFVDEQGVPEALEIDGRDDGAWHLLARDAAGLPVGCVRLLPDAHIGRLAVLRGRLPELRQLVERGPFGARIAPVAATVDDEARGVAAVSTRLA